MEKNNFEGDLLKSVVADTGRLIGSDYTNRQVVVSAAAELISAKMTNADDFWANIKSKELISKALYSTLSNFDAGNYVKALNEIAVETNALWSNLYMSCRCNPEYFELAATLKPRLGFDIDYRNKAVARIASMCQSGCTTSELVEFISAVSQGRLRYNREIVCETTNTNEVELIELLKCGMAELTQFDHFPLRILTGNFSEITDPDHDMLMSTQAIATSVLNSILTSEGIDIEAAFDSELHLNEASPQLTNYQGWEHVERQIELMDVNDLPTAVEALTQHISELAIWVYRDWVVNQTFKPMPESKVDKFVSLRVIEVALTEGINFVLFSPIDASLQERLNFIFSRKFFVWTRNRRHKQLVQYMPDRRGNAGVKAKPTTPLEAAVKPQNVHLH